VKVTRLPPLRRSGERMEVVAQLSMRLAELSGRSVFDHLYDSTGLSNFHYLDLVVDGTAVSFSEYVDKPATIVVRMPRHCAQPSVLLRKTLGLWRVDPAVISWELAAVG